MVMFIGCSCFGVVLINAKEGHPVAFGNPLLT